MVLLYIFSAMLSACYVWWVARVWQGFKAYKNFVVAEEIEQVGISIVIPFRNEEKNLPALLSSISRLNYPQQLFEVVLVNDASEDQSVALVEDWIKSAMPHAKLVHATGFGKKAAQFVGIKAAKYALIACTDADCELPENWLRAVNAAFGNPKIKLAFGPVLLRGGNQHLQRLEFLSLIGSTMGMLHNGWPVMGNAANMAVLKSAYLAAFPSLEKRTNASGDDVFLLHELAAQKGAIAVLHSSDAFVKTQPQQNLKALVWQRMRWASKATFYTNKTAVAVAILVFGVNVFLLFLAVFAFVKPEAAHIFWALFGLKFVTDFMLLSVFATYFLQPISVVLVALQEFLNLLYVPFVALFSQIFSYTWKGRIYGVRNKA